MNRERVLTPRVILQLLLFVVVVPFLPLLISWRWNGWEAWVYALIGVLDFIISRALAARRHPGVWLLLLVPLFILLAGCAGEEASVPADDEASFIALDLSSPAFRHGDAIPANYTCDGDDVSPPLQWQDVPAGAQSLALIVDDPDAPRGTWDHWLLYDIPPETRQLPQDVAPAASLPGGGSQGNNSWNRLGYGGPCPPGGSSHR